MDYKGELTVKNSHGKSLVSQNDRVLEHVLGNFLCVLGRTKTNSSLCSVVVVNLKT